MYEMKLAISRFARKNQATSLMKHGFFWVKMFNLAPSSDIYDARVLFFGFSN